MKVPGVKGQDMSDFQVTISEKLREQALALLAQHGKLEGILEIPSEGGEVKALLSPNAADLIPLQEITFQGQTYYLGIPRE